MTDTNAPTFDAAGPGRTQRFRYENWTVAIRWTAGIVFVVFGAGKYVNHASELASFRGYSLPAPAVAVYVIGAIEIIGGLLLAAGVLVRAAAVVLAGDMVGAIVVSGLARGEYISLTLAPVLLVAMIFLIGVSDRGWSLIGTVTPGALGGHRGR
ncbi:MAG: DoxX family protein [Solirubrobacteraceae bacterium]